MFFLTVWSLKQGLGPVCLLYVSTRVTEHYIVHVISLTCLSTAEIHRQVAPVIMHHAPKTCSPRCVDLSFFSDSVAGLPGGSARRVCTSHWKSGVAVPRERSLTT